MWLREGLYDSGVQMLPPTARRGRVLWASPAGEPVRGVCLSLAAWNDETFDFRLRLLAPVVRRGLAVMLLENPHYGRRRPPERRHGTPRTVREFLELGFGTIEEARGLLAGLREAGIARVGVTGYSMGGHMAALTAGSLPWPVRVAALAPSCSPASVFVDGLLSVGTRFASLGEDAPSGRLRLRRLLDRFAVTELPPPPAATDAIIVGTLRDGIVPPTEPQRIADHWGARLRWLDTGHVGAVTLHRAALRAAVVAAMSPRG